ncbi:forkhead domain-containing protein [Cryptococcus neoformans]|nr:forkhead domain-containing protein [Cryptococcus neoformans var. grubii]OXC60162.1 forkhead domain-containing protein [Cryptococcus neoformans var. grubii MW-RSA852]
MEAQRVAHPQSIGVSRPRYPGLPLLRMKPSSPQKNDSWDLYSSGSLSSSRASTPPSASSFHAPDPGVEGIPDGPRPLTRPQAPLAFLMGQAILSSSRGGLSLGHIYRWIETAYPFFAADTAGWRNSVRHTLSTNKVFEKTDRTTDYPSGKGGIWTIKKGEEWRWDGVETFTRTFQADSERVKSRNRTPSQTSEASTSSAAVIEPHYGLEPGTEGIPEGPRPFTRPQAPLAFLMGQAILSSSFGGLSLEHIYRWIETAYPFFATDTAGWRNSVRHTLSIHKMFAKVERTDKYPRGKGCIWTIVKGEECHWGENETFTKNFPPGHPHYAICRQTVWDKERKGEGKKGGKRKKRLSDEVSELNSVPESGLTTPIESISPKVRSPHPLSNVPLPTDVPPVMIMYEKRPSLPPLRSFSGPTLPPFSSFNLQSDSSTKGVHRRSESLHSLHLRKYSSEFELPPIKRFRVSETLPSIDSPAFSGSNNIRPTLPPIRDHLTRDQISASGAVASPPPYLLPITLDADVAPLYERTSLYPQKQTSYERYSSSLDDDTPNDGYQYNKFDAAFRRANERLEVVEVDGRGEVREDMGRRKPWNGFRFWVP